MKTPNVLYHFGLFFDEDALEGGRSVEDVLCEYTQRRGMSSLKKIQRILAENLASGDIEVMQELWDEAKSAYDFGEATDEFFQKIVEYDHSEYFHQSEYAGIRGAKWRFYLIRIYSILKN